MELTKFTLIKLSEILGVRFEILASFSMSWGFLASFSMSCRSLASYFISGESLTSYSMSCKSLASYSMSCKSLASYSMPCKSLGLYSLLYESFLSLSSYAWKSLASYSMSCKSLVLHPPPCKSFAYSQWSASQQIANVGDNILWCISLLFVHENRGDVWRHLFTKRSECYSYSLTDWLWVY